MDSPPILVNILMLVHDFIHITCLNEQFEILEISNQEMLYNSDMRVCNAKFIWIVSVDAALALC